MSSGRLLRGMVTAGVLWALLVTAWTGFATVPCDTTAAAAREAGLLRDRDRAQTGLEDLATRANGPAEVASVLYHQQALLDRLSTAYLTEHGMTEAAARNLREAIVKSDIGKLGVYKKWWTEASPESSGMIDALQLKGGGPLATELARLSGGRPMINPALSADLVRQIFRLAFFAPGYFHEFPGMRVAELDLAAGRLTPAAFAEQIRGIYGHNGPGDPAHAYDGKVPFWATVPDAILKQIEQGVADGRLPPAARDLFKGTAFEGEGGRLRYMDPVSRGGAEHVIEDRFDGYRDSRKIREEISFMPPISAEVDMLLGSNYWGTRAALKYNVEHMLPRLRERGHLTEAEFTHLTQVTGSLLARLEAMHKKFESMIDNPAEVARALAEAEGPAAITFVVPGPGGGTERVTFSRADLGNSRTEAARRFRDWVDANIRAPVMAADGAGDLR